MWATLNKPSQGEATRLALIWAIIDNLGLLRTQQSTGALIPNGSFEDDADADGVPDQWTKTLFTGGTFAIDTTDQQHGDSSAKFTSPGGAGNGGGYLTTDDFFPVSPNRTVEVLWEMKSSAAGVSNRVEIFWYKADQTASGTTSSSLYNSTANPTAWTAMSGSVTPPSDARFAKIRITGCHTASTTAGSTWFDNVQVRLSSQIIPTIEVLTGSGNWTCPISVRRARLKGWGGGGGGAAGTSGGGGGAYGEQIVDLVPGDVYAYACGAGGSVGNNGGTTTFGALLSVNGGTAGSGSAAGGAAGASSIAIAGQAGAVIAGTDSLGGASPQGGLGGSQNSRAGSAPGGGGARNAAGANGMIVLEY